MDTLGDALRLLREARKLTQRQVGEALQIDASVVSAWERGRSSPSARRLGDLADLLDLDLGDLDDALELAGGPPRARWRTPRAESDPRARALVRRLLAPGGEAARDRAEQTLSELLTAALALADSLRQPPSGG